MWGQIHGWLFYMGGLIIRLCQDCGSGGGEGTLTNAFSSNQNTLNLKTFHKDSGILTWRQSPYHSTKPWKDLSMRLRGFNVLLRRVQSPTSCSISFHVAPDLWYWFIIWKINIRNKTTLYTIPLGIVIENCLVLSVPPESYIMKMYCSWFIAVYHTGIFLPSIKFEKFINIH